MKTSFSNFLETACSDQPSMQGCGHILYHWLSNVVLKEQSADSSLPLCDFLSALDSLRAPLVPALCIDIVDASPLQIGPAAQARASGFAISEVTEMRQSSTSFTSLTFEDAYPLSAERTIHHRP